jgi:hypothetical protein
MRRHIISYWRPETAIDRLSASDQVLRELEPYGRIRIDLNDEVWVVTVVRGFGELYLIGHIIVGRLTETHQAWHYHISAKRGTGEELRCISLTDEAPQLRFHTKAKGADRLSISSDGRVDALQFSSPRHLTQEAAELLLDRWSEAPTKEMMIAEEEELDRSGKLGKANPLVEDAAIQKVTEHYKNRGWQVQPVETENRGYDLLCTKDRREEHVEVKGLIRDVPDFTMTANELMRAEDDPAFRIAIVTNALSSNLKLEIFTGDALLDIFDFHALQYRVTKR